ncbi:MAG: molybdopterin-dependent oxidoreductase [Salinisphaera sp.]|nr:molybdopterin-dependent oxidoreductase [Salinisphaera sp.]
MTPRIDTARRRFITRSLAASSAALLTGCDTLSRTDWFTRMLGSAEALNQRVHHFITPAQAQAREFTEADISAHFKSNGTRYPDNIEYQVLALNNFANWRLQVGGLVEKPTRLSLAQVRGLPARTQITRHDCVEGWSCIGKWKGAKLGALMELVQPLPNARYVVCYCYDSLIPLVHEQYYYESIPIEAAYYEQTILAYEMNDQVLPIPYGAPLRLRLERQLGYKMAKYLKRIELVESFDDIYGGHGGYWEDRGYAWYAGI